jgi:hypothetical protein
MMALTTETAGTSETSVNFYQTARRYNAEQSRLHTSRRENLKSHCEVYVKLYLDMRAVCKMTVFCPSTMTCLQRMSSKCSSNNTDKLSVTPIIIGLTFAFTFLHYSYSPHAFTDFLRHVILRVITSFVCWTRLPFIFLIDLAPFVLFFTSLLPLLGHYLLRSCYCDATSLQQQLANSNQPN